MSSLPPQKVVYGREPITARPYICPVAGVRDVACLYASPQGQASAVQGAIRGRGRFLSAAYRNLVADLHQSAIALTTIVLSLMLVASLEMTLRALAREGDDNGNTSRLPFARCRAVHVRRSLNAAAFGPDSQAIIAPGMARSREPFRRCPIGPPAATAGSSRPTPGGWIVAGVVCRAGSAVPASALHAQIAAPRRSADGRAGHRPTGTAAGEAARSEDACDRALRQPGAASAGDRSLRAAACRARNTP